MQSVEPQGNPFIFRLNAWSYWEFEYVVIEASELIEYKFTSIIFITALIVITYGTYICCKGRSSHQALVPSSGALTPGSRLNIKMSSYQYRNAFIMGIYIFQLMIWAGIILFVRVNTRNTNHAWATIPIFDCVRHVPWCMPGSLTSGFLRSRWREKRSRHSWRMRNTQFYASVKRPIDYAGWACICLPYGGSCAIALSRNSKHPTCLVSSIK